MADDHPYNPLDRLLAKQAINVGQHKAGREYARLRGDAKPAYAKARQALLGHRRRVTDIVDNAAVYRRHVKDRNVPALRNGLDILARTLGA